MLRDKYGITEGRPWSFEHKQRVTSMERGCVECRSAAWRIAVEDHKRQDYDVLDRQMGQGREAIEPMFANNRR